MPEWHGRADEGEGMLLMTETERAEPAEPLEPDEDGAAPTWYERAQHRLRVDGVAFGQAVTRLREAEGWSVRTLSRKSGVPLTTLAKLERGGTDVPDVEVATALALTFGYTSPGAMLGAGATAWTPGRRRATAEREGGPITLEHLVESLLRAIRAANDVPPVTAPLPSGAAAAGAGPEARAAAADVLRGLPGAGGNNLYVPLVVLLQPRTGG